MNDIKDHILECSQVYLDMLGYTKEEIREFTCQQLIPKRWCEMGMAIVGNRIVKKGYSDVYE